MHARCAYTLCMHIMPARHACTLCMHIMHTYTHEIRTCACRVQPDKPCAQLWYTRARRRSVLSAKADVEGEPHCTAQTSPLALNMPLIFSTDARHPGACSEADAEGNGPRYIAHLRWWCNCVVRHALADSLVWGCTGAPQICHVCIPK